MLDVEDYYMCVSVLGLNDEEETALIELMMCAVRQAAEGTPPTARALGKKVEERRGEHKSD